MLSSERIIRPLGTRSGTARTPEGSRETEIDLAVLDVGIGIVPYFGKVPRP